MNSSFEKVSQHIDKKFLTKFIKVIRYNPDPMSITEPMHGDAVAPHVVAVVRDKHFVKVMKALGIYNAVSLGYENYVWKFFFRFSDDYRVELMIGKYVSRDPLQEKHMKDGIVFEQAVEQALIDALKAHESFCKIHEKKIKEREEDIQYE